MFSPTGWFALDAANRRVPGVVVGSLPAGLALIGQGPVASVVGVLRPEVLVVDVDLAGVLGDAAMESVASWCERTGVWCLTRPSGGPAGHGHVFVAPGARGPQLETFIEQLRHELGVSRRAIDLRTTVRPLSAPHRSGVSTRPYGDIQASLRALRALPWAAASPAAAGRVRARAARESLLQAGEALQPRRRPRRDLPQPWQTYLETGATPPVGGRDRSRTTVEAIATGHLLRAGHDAASAWQAIVASHPSAFTRARVNKRRWVAHVWNPSVRDDDAFAPAPQGVVDDEVVAAVEAARTRLQDLAWTFPARRRAGLLLVGHTVLDRMLRAGSRRVPVPERDLVLDTGLADRATIRGYLRALAGPVGVLDTAVWDPARREASSFEFEVPAAGGVRDFHPPSSHTPLPPEVNGGLWATLPRICHQIWRALRHQRAPVTLAVLGVEAAICDTREADLTDHQVRMVRAGLTALLRAGMADCNAGGEWVVRSTVNGAQRVVARQWHEEATTAVVAEREAYRAGAGSRWSRERAAALKANRAREVAWWSTLPRAEREQRSRAWAGTFAGLSVHGQEEVKAGLVERRMRAGVDEAARHDGWLDALTWQAYQDRSVERALWFQRLPGPMQAAYAAAWARHRARYGISAGTPLSQDRRAHAAAWPVRASGPPMLPPWGERDVS